MTQEFKIKLFAPAEPDAGLPEFRENVSVVLEFGGHSPAIMEDLKSTLEEALANFFDCDSKVV